MIIKLENVSYKQLADLAVFADTALNMAGIRESDNKFFALKEVKVGARSSCFNLVIEVTELYEKRLVPRPFITSLFEALGIFPESKTDDDPYDLVSPK